MRTPRKLKHWKYYRVVGRRLRAARKARGVMVRQAAEALKLDPVSIRNIEQGRHGIQLHHMIVLVKLYKVSYRYIIEGSYG